MSLMQTILYDTAGNFTFDSDLIEIASSVASLKLIDNPSQTFSQTYASSAGFTFDSSFTEFTGGVLRQKDTRPTNETLYSRLVATATANWSTGSGTGTATAQVTYGANGANLSAAAQQYIDYSATSNLGVQIGTLRMRVTPGFTSIPAEIQYLFTSSAANGNISGLMELAILTSGNIQLRVFDSSVVSIFTANLGNVAWVSGQTYEIEVDYDLTNGATRVFVDGIQLGSMQTGVGSRGSVGLVRIGNWPTVANVTTNLSVRDLELFTAVQHTANYSAPFALPSATIYDADTILLPTFTYTGLGSIVAFTSAVVTDTNSPRYVLNGRYWNGSAWVVSNLSFAQANLAATLLANIATLPTSNTLAIYLITSSSNTQMSADLMTVNYTGQIYPVSNPSIINNSGIDLDSLINWEVDSTETGSDAIQFALNVNNQDRYWNGSAWVMSNGTYAQSNTVATIVANAGALDLTGGVVLRMKAFLHSADGTTTPTLTSVTTTYDFFVPIPDEPNHCIVYCFLNDFMGLITNARSAILSVELETSFAYGGRIIAPFKRTFNFNSNGYTETTPDYLTTADSTASDGIVETESVSLSPYKFTIQYQNLTNQLVRIDASAVQVPNQSTVNLAELFF